VAFGEVSRGKQQENRRGIFPQQFRRGSKEMADAFYLVMLVCAAVGSMAFGVLTAYGLFRVGFALMRPRSARVSLKVSTQLAPE
jgi:hypothetical protein